jgi:8-oxo-dGTP diphosphatase
VATQIGIAVVEQEGRVLVGVRPAGAALAGDAEFPGGKCAPNEAPADCAVRECEEETGLAVRPVRLLDRCRHRYPHGEVDLHFWLCKPLTAEMTPQSPWWWCPLAALPALQFPPANATAIALLQAPRSEPRTQ